MSVSSLVASRITGRWFGFWPLDGRARARLISAGGQMMDVFFFKKNKHIKSSIPWLNVESEICFVPFLQQFPPPPPQKRKTEFNSEIFLNKFKVDYKVSP
jgi:hypothetical protein